MSVTRCSHILNRKLDKMKNITIIILVVFNLIVLLGQVWPEGAPPFARYVNIGFLMASLVFFVVSLRDTTSK